MKLRLLFIVLTFSVLVKGTAYAQCINPVGAEGDVVFNETYNVPQYCDGSDTWIAMTGNGAPYKPNAVEFDGSSTSLARNDDLTGITDTKVWSGFGWFKRNGIGSNTLYTATSSAARIRFTSLDFFEVFARNSALTEILECRSSAAYTDNKWHSFIFSFDLSDSNKQHLYIDGADALGGPCSIYTDDTINVSTSNHQIGSNSGGSDNWFNGDMADIWIDFGTYVDLSVVENRRKFISESGMPMYLGADGSTPTGAQPDIFLSGDTNTWHVNKGSGGGFDENGELTTAATSPGDVTRIVPDGLVGHWRLDETSGTGVVDYAGNNNGTVQGGLDPATNSVEGRIGRALSFDGVDDSVDFADDIFDSLNEGAVSAWFKWDGSNASDFQAIVGVDQDAFQPISIENYDLYMFSNCAVRFTTNGNLIQPDIWYHVVYISDATGNRIFLNGNQLNSSELTYTLGSPTTQAFFSQCDDVGSTLAFGDYAGVYDEPFSGIIDDVRIYNRALTDEEVTEIYQARDGIRYNSSFRTPEFFDGNKWVAMPPPFADVTDGLVGHWKLDEADGTTVHDEITGNDSDIVDAASLISSPGVIGPGLYLNGTYHFDASTHNAYALAESWTISVWAKTPDTGSNRYFTMRGSFPERNYMMNFNSSGRVEVGYDNGDGNFAGKRTDTSYDDDTWRHFVGMFDDVTNSLSIYVDGVLVPQSDIGVGVGTEPSAALGLRLRIFNNASIDGSGRLIGSADDFRLYNRTLSENEIQTLYNMGTRIGSSTALPQGCPDIGDVCDDGSYYIGDIGAGNIYATDESLESSEPWNNGVSYSGWTTTGFTSETDGEGNTAGLVALDDDGSPYEAAEYCYGLNAHGYNDWYWPARDELNLFWNGGSPIAGVTEDGSNYWASSEINDQYGRYQRFNDGNQFGNDKDTNNRVRCVRRGPAPRCANPYGREGNMFYNTTHSVVQYCDGARWVAIGKTAP